MIKRTINKSRILMILLIVLLIGRVTYAFFTSRGESSNQTITTANMNLDINPKEATIIGSNLMPIKESEINIKGAKKTFSITNKNSQEMYVSIELDITEMDAALKSNDFKWALYKGIDNTGENIGTGSFSTASLDNNFVLKNNIEYNATNINVETNYTLYIWINETNIDQNDLQDKSFQAKIVAKGLFE